MAVLRYFRILLKGSEFIVVISLFILVSLFNRVRTKDPIKRRHLYSKTACWAAQKALNIIHFKINYINSPDPNKSYLFVGNHLGIIEILIIAAHRECLFITSQDMRQTAGLGFLTEMAGCLYVDRQNRSNIKNEIIEIREALEQGFNVVLYPEGTSTNGERVLPFKKTLMTAAAGTGVPIMPMVINFRKVNGEPMSHKFRDDVTWYGDHTFAAVLLRLLALKSVEADLEFCEEVLVHNEEERRKVAAVVQSAVVARYTKIPLPPGEISPYAHISEAT